MVVGKRHKGETFVKPTNSKEVANTIVSALRALARILSRTICDSVAHIAPLFLLIGCQGQSPKSVTVPESSPSSLAEQDSGSIGLELNRAVSILNQGIAANWGNRDRYLSAFAKTPDVDTVGKPITDAKSYVTCVIDRHFRNHEVWDEGVPIDAEARLAVIELMKLREYKKADLPSCVLSEHRKITLSAGVAASLLKIKIDPIYPANALQHNISGTVTLRATIDTDGHVTAPAIISGPDELRQAALNAVSQWTYKPYQLNGRPVEVETSISVPFELHR